MQRRADWAAGLDRLNVVGQHGVEGCEVAKLYYEVEQFLVVLNSVVKSVPGKPTHTRYQKGFATR